MTENELRDQAAVAIFPHMLQANTTIAQGLAGAEPKIRSDPGRAAVMAYQAAEWMIHAKRLSADHRAKEASEKSDA